MEIVIFIFFGLILVSIPVFLLDNVSNAKFFCNVLGWHKVPKEKESNGKSMTGTCPRCLKKVTNDGRGNWFVSPKPKQ